MDRNSVTGWGADLIPAGVLRINRRGKCPDPVSRGIRSVEIHQAEVRQETGDGHVAESNRARLG
jgi:hypothetical protein